ncbi:uncharacterized protein MAM_04500 [Metarhizium album ARSEF 1941]|uniref:Uncharacterized protein n=1 Tax=Metarhizium album (strain ARSEF 1941) TaxID=1081103 RepID=A0A0B2WX87_METAS|nr:uncharacterized protein MAM_04500 [Metarhizium album ARSEF 1941]KHN97485.1 hypothetical protein MAM_04500 [Metarhizium album ARSEF 1941]
MSPRATSRAGSSARSTQNSQARAVKRNRRSESPICLSSIARISPEEAKRARQRVFDNLGCGDPHPGMPRAISSADQLTEVQLGRLFDMLHACGRATDEQATLLTTRASIDGFVDAVFNDWNSGNEEGMVKPELEFLVEEEVVAGTICVVSALASYSCNPAMLKMEYTVVDPFSGQSEAFCPLWRNDIHWAQTGWKDTLRQAMEGKLVSKIHRYNKHLAVWQARKLIQSWSKGGISSGPDPDRLGFIGREAAKTVLMGL